MNRVWPLVLAALLFSAAQAKPLTEAAVKNITAHSEKTCQAQAKQFKQPGTHCGAWARCYGKQVQRTTSLEEMTEADKQVAAGKKPGDAFVKKMMQAAAFCTQSLQAQKK